MKNQRGQTTTEYILIIALIVAVIIGAFKIFGPKIKEAFTNVADKVATESSK